MGGQLILLRVEKMVHQQPQKVQQSKPNRIHRRQTRSSRQKFPQKKNRLSKTQKTLKKDMSRAQKKKNILKTLKYHLTPRKLPERNVKTKRNLTKRPGRKWSVRGKEKRGRKGNRGCWKILSTPRRGRR